MNQQQKIVYRLAELIGTNERLRKIITMRIEEIDNNDEAIQVELKKLDSLLTKPLIAEQKNNNN